MKLLIYRNEKEYKDYLTWAKENALEVVPFRFKEIADRLKDGDTKIIIDITLVLWFISLNKADRYTFFVNFIDSTKETLIIANKKVLGIVETELYNYFDEFEYIYKEDKYQEITSQTVNQLIRRPAYFYVNDEHLNNILDYCAKNNILFLSFNQINSNQNKFDCINKDYEFFLDLDSVLYALENNKNFIYLIEEFLVYYPNAIIVFNQRNQDTLRKYFALSINTIEIIDIKIPECKLTDYIDTSTDKKNLITDLSKVELDSFFKEFDERLTGHHFFKDKFAKAIKEFVVLNKVGKRKVLSFYLFGESGIGKTETARIIQELLYKNTNLVKINFGNYSSRESLNNLIGSPRGYIGCEDGELGKKIVKSKTGVILFDEIEKADNNVINFFLELLEDGSFTDTLAREYDLNGYIIIFSSNLKTVADFTTKLPKEFQSRLDVICNFTNISVFDKKKFIAKTISEAALSIKKEEQYKKFTMSKDEIKVLIDRALTYSTNLREIKKFVFNEIVSLADKPS